jgi:hypothetical protein
MLQASLGTHNQSSAHVDRGTTISLKRPWDSARMATA